MQWLKNNWRKVAAALKAAWKAWTAVCVCLLLVGCSSTTITRTEYDPQGRVTAKTVMDGDTESIAAQGHKEVALKAMDKLDKLTSSATIPTYNAQGEPTSITLKFVDSAVYRAMAELSDMSGYDSQSVKITKQVTGTLNKALHPAMTFGIVDIVTTRGTGSDNSTTYNDSFNNPNQSPQTVDNVAAHVTPTATDSHSVSTSTETNETTTEVVDDDG